MGHTARMRAPAAVAVLLLGFGLRARALHQGSLGFDGGLAVALAASPPRELIELSARDVHPPLYYLALAGWWRIAGPGPGGRALAEPGAGRARDRGGLAARRPGSGRETALATAGLLALSPAARLRRHGRARLRGARPADAAIAARCCSSGCGLPAAGRGRPAALAALYLAGLLTSYYFALDGGRPRADAALAARTAPGAGWPRPRRARWRWRPGPRSRPRRSGRPSRPGRARPPARRRRWRRC